ncbi:sigma-70 family RNA polymerase sigma factor [Elstera cyanobacteriorum]|uniref:sigma-70 family RNA polymerase sigma factor n=1 Tax=Elstera cyanobacteriorum TaxID=2022747 RepID=UPI002355F9D3|nr:sigma-70 family RNA polymerase sigma factor [Elstera cyanobacteriorum]MCK6442961.1 sigma-70 family RNA polymerase sigma factor [Elstera cyanobacteriorum]
MSLRKTDVDADFDQAALVAGEEKAWGRFIARFTRVVAAAIRTVPGIGTPGRGEPGDLVQDVFVKLLADDRRLLKTYDPARAAPATWLTLVSRSIARDRLRAKQLPGVPIDDVPESAFAVEPDLPAEKVQIPPGLLSPRQELILSLLYDQDMDVAEAAAFLQVEAQTIRSMHHKALTKLRAHFAAATTGGDETAAPSLQRDRR